MKKMSFARRNALFPRGVRALPAVLLGVAVLALIVRFLLPDVFIALVSPLWSVTSFASNIVYDATAALRSPVMLKHTLDAELSDNAALTSENATLRSEVEDLQKLLGSRKASEKGILASVLARPPLSPYDTLVVDQGSGAGVSAGALVTGPGGTPLGKVQSVTGSNARVALFSASGTKTDAWIGEHRLPVTLTGTGGGTFDASAPKDANIAAGDAVLVQGGFSIGTVVRVDSDASSPSATLGIQSAISPFTLVWVLISKNI